MLDKIAFEEGYLVNQIAFRPLDYCNSSGIANRSKNENLLYNDNSQLRKMLVMFLIVR